VRTCTPTIQRRGARHHAVFPGRAGSDDGDSKLEGVHKFRVRRGEGKSQPRNLAGLVGVGFTGSTATGTVRSCSRRSRPRPSRSCPPRQSSRGGCRSAERRFSRGPWPGPRYITRETLVERTPHQPHAWTKGDTSRTVQFPSWGSDEFTGRDGRDTSSSFGPGNDLAAGGRHGCAGRRRSEPRRRVRITSPLEDRDRGAPPRWDACGSQTGNGSSHGTWPRELEGAILERLALSDSMTSGFRDPLDITALLRLREADGLASARRTGSTLPHQL